MVNLLGIIDVQLTIEFMHERFLLKRNYLCCREFCKTITNTSKISIRFGIEIDTHYHLIPE